MRISYRHFPQKYLWRLVTLIGAVSAWELLARGLNNPTIFPTIKQIVSYSFPSIALFADSPNPTGSVSVALRILAWHSLLTLWRILSGVVIGATLGVSAGVAVHLMKSNSHSNKLILAGARTVPLLALIPLFIYWFGNRQIGIYVYISFGVFVIMSTVTYEAISNIPVEYLHQTHLLGAGGWRDILSVYLHAIQPQVFPALREVVGLSWAFSLGAEYVVKRDGLGYLVSLSYQYSDMGKLFVFAAIYVLYGYLGYLLITAITRKVGRWYLAESGKEAL